MVMGDSAFGFSGMEIETAARYNLPLKVVIINNNGIGNGTEEFDKSDVKAIPVSALTINAHYEYMSTAFGGKGTQVFNHKDL